MVIFVSRQIRICSSDGHTWIQKDHGVGLLALSCPQNLPKCPDLVRLKWFEWLRLNSDSII